MKVCCDVPCKTLPEPTQQTKLHGERADQIRRVLSFITHSNFYADVHYIKGAFGVDKFVCCLNRSSLDRLYVVSVVPNKAMQRVCTMQRCAEEH